MVSPSTSTTSTTNEPDTFAGTDNNSEPVRVGAEFGGGGGGVGVGVGEGLLSEDPPPHPVRNRHRASEILTFFMVKSLYYIIKAKTNVTS
jgi:hypothetical protein